jgi:2OG-Fe(II) oxygenase superfamily
MNCSWSATGVSRLLSSIIRLIIALFRHRPSKLLDEFLVTAAIEAMDRLAELSTNTAWWVHERPFRHIRAENVFSKEVYDHLATAFLTMRDTPEESSPDEPKFRKAQSTYDALILPMTQRLATRFAPLFERRWIDFLANLLDLQSIPQIDGALHHIPVNSRSGWIHNDFCSGWFNRSHTGDIVFPDRRNCDYFTGTAHSPEARPQEFIRAATMIFYLQNDEWNEGCGGETGLYAASRNGLADVTVAPPVNNSLLLFACSPHSYHSLVGNPGCARNSIILWLHSSLENAQMRWGRAFTRRKPK